MKKNRNKVKIGRNDLCPCGSGLKYKKCCLRKRKVSSPEELKALYWKRHRIRLKEPEDIRKIRECGKLVLATLDEAEAAIRTGITTDEINTIVHEYTLANGATPAPLNYRGFPKSTCVSVNEVICHGVPGPRVLQDGDIVNVDVTSILDGYFADANKTFFVGTPGEDAKRIVQITKESLKRGIEMVKPGNTLGDMGWAIQTYVEGEGCSVVRDFVGHGVGFKFHEAPQVLHYGTKGSGVPFVPGMVFTIEPMINLGKREVRILGDKWTAVTRDGSLSCQFEQTVLVTEDGCESLTPFEL